jgi:hypothetical protein
MGEGNEEMSSHKFDNAVFFLDAEGTRRFLFRLMNIGKNDADDLKFVVVPANSGLGLVLAESRTETSSRDRIVQYLEYTYHADGSLLQKFRTHRSSQAEYRNPAGSEKRRRPLSALAVWEPFLRYSVYDYTRCKPINLNCPCTILRHADIFDGDPFVCTLFLGSMAYATPPYEPEKELIERLNDVAHKVDLCIWIYKSSSQPEPIRLPGSDLVLNPRANWIEVVENTR